ncbi:hypothetical protein N656DRAFT_352086 [Canariomyces notabilis]|uniref:Fork-head domain-containing protein n=1 Tax=Canariomyces notabilis TaxID=2074819 RepID=A0AAN6T9V7_9PEZI|nr:hypothetical protein N656DRAFT_352086 [Canariomyces arenarius]
MTLAFHFGSGSGNPEYPSIRSAYNRSAVDTGLRADPACFRRHAKEAHSSPGMSIADTETVNGSPPHQASQRSASPNSANSGLHFAAGMSGQKNRGGLGARRPFVTSNHAHGPLVWSTSLGTPTGNVDLDNYSLHSSPAIACHQRHLSSTQSSPRSWASQDQLQVVPAGWEPESEHLHVQYQRLDPQLSGFRPGGGNSYLQTNNSQMPTPFSTDTFQTPSALDSGYPEAYLASSRHGSSSTSESGQPLSPCSTALGPSMEEGALSPTPGAAAVEDVAMVQHLPDTRADGHSRQTSSATSSLSSRGASTDLTNSSNKNEEPYAQLIYRALMSNPRYAMTLQEIYQWFRENTDKDKNDSSKGWMNSIRHNLSMNQAFTKRDRKLSGSRGGEADKVGLSAAGTQADSKKATEWYLEPWAIEEGVQSTTRYRKGTQSGRSAARHNRGSSGRGYGNYQHGSGSRGADLSRYGATDRKRTLSSNSSSRMMRHHHATLHNTSAAAAAASQIQQHYHHFTHAHHAHQQHQHQQQQQQLLQDTLSNNPSAYAHLFPSAAVPVPNHVQLADISSSTTTGMINRTPTTTTTAAAAATGTIDLDLDFSTSQPLFQPTTPNHQHHQHLHNHHQRAHSEATIDEPVTPEPPSYTTDRGVPGVPGVPGGLYYTIGDQTVNQHSSSTVGIPVITAAASYVPSHAAGPGGGGGYEDVYVFGIGSGLAGGGGTGTAGGGGGDGGLDVVDVDGHIEQAGGYAGHGF